MGNEDDVVIELCFNLLEGARFVGLSIANDILASGSLIGVGCVAGHQSSPDTIDGLPGQRHGQVLQRALDFMSERPIQPARCSERAIRSQEARIDTREGEELRWTYSSRLGDNLMEVRSMPRKLQKKRVDARSRREFAIETLTISGNGNEESVAGDADAAAEEVEILTDVHPATHGLRPREDAAHLIATTTEDHRRDGRWTHISLAVVEGDIEMREDVAHHQLRDPSRAPDLHPPQPIAVGCAMIADHDMIDVGTGRTDHAHHLPDDKIPEGGEEGLQIVVITEQDPLLL